MSLLDDWGKDASGISPCRVAVSEKTEVNDKSACQLVKGWAFEAVLLWSGSDQGYLLGWRILLNLILYNKASNVCVDRPFTANGARSETSDSRAMG